MRHLLEYTAGFVILKALGLLPRPLAHRMAILLAEGLYWITPKFRRVAERNLRMALPNLTPQERKVIGRGVYQSLARLLAACAHFPALNAQNVQRAVFYEGLENYHEARARGRGVLFLTAHLGAWELGAFAHALRGYPLHILYRPLDNPRLDRLVNRYRVLSGNTLIDKRNSAREVLSALARNETIGILADQNSSLEEGVFVNFFGIPACTTAGIARIALHTGAAVVPAFCVWDSGQRRFRIIFDKPLELPATGGKEESIRAATQQMTSVVEQYIRRYPDQWLWIHRRWKTRPPGEPPIYS
ncbi:MAG: lysophospholipid acyltransferase family protein [Acidobacteria bacterium]|nr:lysophospholipid acyltransferase family protein [Acidobacteriota bacterium]